MKKLTFTFATLIFTSLFLSCEKNYDDTLVASIVLQNQYYDYQEIDGVEQLVKYQNITCEATLSGNPFPTIEYLQIENKKSFEPSDSYTYFSTISYWCNYGEDEFEKPITDSLHIILKSSTGKLEGYINIPDTLETIIVDVPDQIPVGTSITVSWNESKADFYQVRYIYNFNTSDQSHYEEIGDTIVTGNSVLFEGSRFSYDGIIAGFEVTPVSGPIPFSEIKTNMKGDGYGYLFLRNEAKRIEKFIYVGNALNEANTSFWMDKSTELKNNSALQKLINNIHETHRN